MIPAKLIKRRCYESMSRQKVQSILSTPPTPKPSPRHNNSIPKDLYMFLDLGLTVKSKIYTKIPICDLGHKKNTFHDYKPKMIDLLMMHIIG